MMKSITAGLCLSLIGGVAMAQTAPAPASPPKPSAAQPMPPAAPQAMPVPGGAPGPQPNVAAQAGPPEGEIIETPNGIFLVRPGQGPTPLDIRPSPGHGALPNMADDDDEPGGDAMPPHPHPRGGMPPHGAPGKGARFRIQTPSMTIGVKCPDDESMKACVDAISGLLDKASPQPHS